MSDMKDLCVAAQSPYDALKEKCFCQGLILIIQNLDDTESLC